MTSKCGMNRPVPISRAREAFSKLIEYRRAGKDLDEFSLLRFEREARASLADDPVAAYQALGLIGMFNWDSAVISENFEKARDAGGGHIVIANHARSLRDINDLAGCAQQIEQAASLAPENLAYLREAVTNRFCMGDWQRAGALLEILETRLPAVDSALAGVRNIIDNSARVGLKEETVQLSMAAALDYLTLERVRMEAVGDSFDDLPGDECIYFDLFVAKPTDAARKLDESLTPYLFDKVPDLQLGVFLLSIESTDNVNYSG